MVTDCGWLVILFDDGEAMPPEIHVFDLCNNYSKRCVFRGAQYQNCTGLMPYPQSGSKKVLFFLQHQQIPEVLDLLDGSFILHSSFSFPIQPKSIIPAVTTRSFIALVDGAVEKTAIYSVANGEKERVLDHETSRCVVSMARQEVYLGLHDGPSIAAYCLAEPRRA